MENYIFDFDGTLADSGQAAVLATQSAFKEFNLATPTTSQIEYYMGIPIEVSFKKNGAWSLFFGTSIF
ncbi:HAD hydrolase-like protein [Paucilactobacillus hokkaidonensis]|uniref:HAD hydrolase-like protein n=1 Tax=Paucilactobacillus hokkaidonensis TaxID=1193095 RepID=UPI000AE53E43|nr:HAD hydrolase-like protein [Paucilactobacillus hokkaidonensis]